MTSQKSKLFLLPLATVAALFAFATWHWLDTQSIRGPAKPEFDEVPANTPSPQTNPEHASNLERTSRPLPPVPPAPPVINDPKKGEIWLRVIDADTNQPLANAECILQRIHCENGKWACFADVEARAKPGSNRTNHVTDRQTSKNGMLRFSAQMRAVGEYNDVPETDVWAWMDGTYLEAWFPLPAEWEPALTPHALGASILALVANPAATPIDVLVRKRPGIVGTVLNADGSPRATARVYAFLVETTASLHDWALHQEMPYESIFVGRVRSGSPASEGETEGDFLTAEKNRLRSAATRPWLATGAGQPAVGDWNYLTGLTFTKVSHETTTAADGTFVLPKLLSGTWIVIAHSAYEPLADARVVLHALEARVVLRLPPVRLGGLRIHLIDNSVRPESTDLWLHVNQRGPCGLHAYGVDGDTGYWIQTTPTQRDRVFEWGGLTPGPRTVIAVVAEVSHTASVEIQAGTMTEVTIQIGPNATGFFKPFIRFGGRPVKGGKFLLEGGHYAADTVDLSWPEDAAEPESLELPCGEYSVWVPGLPERRFTINPGESHLEIFDVTVATATFSIDQPLAELIGEEPYEIELNLFGTGLFKDPDFFRFMGEVLRADDESYDVLTPSKSSVWWLPPGEYRWELGSKLSGRVSIEPGGNDIHFTITDLPGLARFDLSVPDATEEHPAAVRFCGLYPGDEAEPVWFTLEDGKRTLAFAPAGHYQAVASLDTNYTVQVVKFPGTASLRPGPASRSDGAMLQITQDEQDNAQYRVVLHDGEGWRSERLCPESVTVTPGRQWLSVDRNASTGNFVHAQLDFNIGDGETREVNLSKLVYVAPGLVTIRCLGRGNPGKTIDPWWMGADEKRPGLHALWSLERGPGGMSALEEMGDPDEILPQGRFEFSYLHRRLPPGRYRAIPWEGAPEKYCRTFEVRSGATVEIIIQGG